MKPYFFNVYRETNGRQWIGAPSASREEADLRAKVNFSRRVYRLKVTRK